MKHVRRIAAASLAVALTSAVPSAAQTNPVTTCPPGSPQCQQVVEVPGGQGGGGGGGATPVDDRPIWTIAKGAANEQSQMLLEAAGTPSEQCYAAVPGGNLTRLQAERLAHSQPDAPGCPDLDGIGSLLLVYEDLVNPPTPQPVFEAERAVTGIPVYVQIGSPANHVEAPPGLNGVTFTLTPRKYRIVWGDGFVSEPEGAGVPYSERNGRDEITHTYRRTGDQPCRPQDPPAWRCFRVVVEVYWSWTATAPDGTFGPFDDPNPSRTEHLLPVRQVQAVRRR